MYVYMYMYKYTPTLVLSYSEEALIKDRRLPVVLHTLFWFCWSACV